jgi:hypothetical protein
MPGAFPGAATIPPAAFDTVHKYVVQLDLYGKGYQVATFLIPNSRDALNAVCRSQAKGDSVSIK